MCNWDEMRYMYILHILVCIRAYLYSSTGIGGLALVTIHNRSYLLFLYKYLQNMDFTPAVKGNFHNRILRYTQRRHKGESDTGEVVFSTFPSRTRTMTSSVIAQFEVKPKEGGGREERRQRRDSWRCVEITCCPGNVEMAEMWSTLRAAGSVLFREKRPSTPGPTGNQSSFIRAQISKWVCSS